LPFSGPGTASGAALRVASSNPGPIYNLVLSNGTLAGGTYTVNGAGGKGVGPFSASVNFPNSFSATNLDAIASIDRSKPLTLNWAAGGAETVYIIASSYVLAGKDASNNNILHSVTIDCQVPAAPGSYTIPAAALSYLLPTGTDPASLAAGSSNLAVEGANVQPFQAPLTNGGTAAYSGFTAIQGYAKTVSVQ
jgi:hypothetical protein